MTFIAFYSTKKNLNKCKEQWTRRAQALNEITNVRGWDERRETRQTYSIETPKPLTLNKSWTLLRILEEKHFSVSFRSEMSVRHVRCEWARENVASEKSLEFFAQTKERKKRKKMAARNARHEMKFVCRFVKTDFHRPSKRFLRQNIFIFVSLRTEIREFCFEEMQKTLFCIAWCRVSTTLCNHTLRRWLVLGFFFLSLSFRSVWFEREIGMRSLNSSLDNAIRFVWRCDARRFRSLHEGIF